MTREKLVCRLKTLLGTIVVLVTFTIVSIIAVQAIECPAYADDNLRARLGLNKTEEVTDPLLEALTFGAAQLQPQLRYRSFREARKLMAVIKTAAERHEISPWIALAVARRESSLLPQVGDGRRLGKRGERGYFQIFPDGTAERVCGRGCDQTNVICNADTAMCWMSRSRELCGESPWLYVGAYGRSRCPENVDEAKTWPEVRNARRFYCEALSVTGQSCDSTWPA